MDFRNLSLSSLKTFQPTIIGTIKEAIYTTTNRDCDDWLTKTINDDIEVMSKAANNMISNNQRIFGDMLRQSPAPAERKTSITAQFDYILSQSTNEIAAETLKAHRLLLNHQSILSNYEQFSVDLYRKNGIARADQMIAGIRTVLANLFATLNAFSTTVIDLVASETKAVIESRPTSFDGSSMRARQTVMEPLSLETGQSVGDAQNDAATPPSSAHGPYPFAPRGSYATPVTNASNAAQTGAAISTAIPATPENAKSADPKTQNRMLLKPFKDV